MKHVVVLSVTWWVEAWNAERPRSGVLETKGGENERTQSENVFFDSEDLVHEKFLPRGQITD